MYKKVKINIDFSHIITLMTYYDFKNYLKKIEENSENSTYAPMRLKSPDSYTPNKSKTFNFRDILKSGSSGTWDFFENFPQLGNFLILFWICLFF